MQTQSPTLRSKLSPWSVRLAAVWILGVSWIKMEHGNPGGIPLIVREFALNPFNEEVTFLATLSIELSFALVALVFPRWGWALITALMSVFVAVLSKLAADGALSCGCFGNAFSMPPLGMLAVDASLLAAMLAARPWQLPKRSVPWIVLAAAAAVGTITPWVRVERQPVFVIPGEPVVHKVEPPSTGPLVAPGTTAPSTTKPVAPPPVVQGAKPPTPKVEPPRLNAEGGNLEVTATTVENWRLPERLPKWARLRPPEWIGKSIHATDLAIWLNTRQYPTDATWILYLETCTHCRDYLDELATNFANDPKIYVYVCLAQPGDDEASIIVRRPPGEIAKLPAEITWVVGPKSPPWELVLEDGVVKAAVSHGE